MVLKLDAPEVRDFKKNAASIERSGAGWYSGKHRALLHKQTSTLPELTIKLDPKDTRLVLIPKKSKINPNKIPSRIPLPIFWPDALGRIEADLYEQELSKAAAGDQDGFRKMMSALEWQVYVPPVNQHETLVRLDLVLVKNGKRRLGLWMNAFDHLYTLTSSYVTGMICLGLEMPNDNYEVKDRALVLGLGQGADTLRRMLEDLYSLRERLQIASTEIPKEG